MKGLALPINAIIIIALAALVLVVMTGFFGGSVSSTQNEIQLDKAFNLACAKLVNVENCVVTGLSRAGVFYDRPGDDLEDDNYYCLDGCDADLRIGDAELKGTSLCSLKGLTESQCLTQCGC